ncbi:hypothetical protein [Paracraurococcus lichenis]|uniref:Uncharacterized protein n=1 Tax=Paracraurococcus lichenis TaxID=3064888 RepID=A0ABT9E3F0_9PROT|nr:hypothetical protein [Paracraurococcus sp. LOR1-02]MDO9710691.1 hypothetical protein [Paracraurococcus sp. LOR1-02]
MMGGTRKGAPTPQGPEAAGPGNAHGAAPQDAPQPWGTDEAPFDPRGGSPAADPEARAEELLAQHRTGRAAAGDAGPEVAGKDPG